MDSMYIKALETRARWLRWAKENQYMPEFKISYAPEMRNYTQVLESGDTFFMNKKFCSLVEHARETVPDDLVFDSTWMQAQQGWLWLDTPFSVPSELEVKDLEKDLADSVKKLGLTDGVTKDDLINGVLPGLKVRDVGGKSILMSSPIKISAIGWYMVPEGIHIGKGHKDELFRVTGTGAYHFLCFQDFSAYLNKGVGFGTWSYFTLQDGDKLIDRVRAFEQFASEDGGGYKQSRISDMMHEIRWVYAAFYLMAQRLAINVKHDTDRHTRRRGERDKRPVPPFIRVVTLRRLEEERRKAGAPSDIEYQCQWEVRGHWRNQYFPSDGTHRQVWIEAYIKGPDDKPLKAPGHKLFVAQR